VATVALSIGAACVVGALCVGTLVKFGKPGAGERAGERITVRSLMESEELASVAAENLLALGGATAEAAVGGRDGVLAKVHAALRNASETIRAQDPISHQQMEGLELSAEQKDKALGVLRKFNDPRVADFAQDAVAAVRESGGDAMHMQRRLAERVAPKYESLRQLAEELGAGTPEAYALKAASRYQVAREAAATGRRLAELNDVDAAGVRAQAHTLLHTLERQLGESMPKAPSRMLLDSSSSGDDSSFMDCVSKAVATMSPTKVVSCVIDNMSDFMSIVKDFMPGGSSSSR